MDGRRRTGQVIDLVDFNRQWADYVVPKKLKIIVANKMSHVGFAAGEEIVQAYHLRNEVHQPSQIAQ